jgi:hypothetical protein
LAEPVSSSRVDWTQLAIGILAAAAGCYFVLAGLNLAPAPGHAKGPGWVVALCGLAFAYAGVAVGARGLLGLDQSQRELPAGTPVWIKALYWYGAVATCAALASVGTWVAIGDGARHFILAGPVAGPVGDGVGRFVFGIGATLTWIITIALACASYRKVFGKALTHEPDAGATR